MNSIFVQLARILNIKAPSKLFTESYQLREFFSDQLITFNLLHPNKKLVIIMDSIDQLDPMDYKLDWLFDNYPDNVKIIFSTLPDHGDILATFKLMSNMSENNFLSIKFNENKKS